MTKSSLPALLICLFCPFALRGQSPLPPEPPTHQSAEPGKLTVPNGTPVMLRFAEPVVGMPQSLTMKTVQHARPGDRVRLVVATDVRVQNLIVVKKGSLAQVTVLQVTRPDKHDESGLQLRFDWMKSVNDQGIPIRQKRNGKDSNKFIPHLFVKPGGTYIGFGLETRTWSDAWRRLMMQEAGQQWTVIPVGTRIRAYVNGDVALDSADVKKALAALPVQNPAATVTIFREKGPANEQPHVVCDEKDFGALGQWQYFLLEMEPGKHLCFSKPDEKFEFSVVAGEDFYMKLRRTKMSGKWELQGMDSATGEDAIANSTLVEISGEAAQAPQQN